MKRREHFRTIELRFRASSSLGVGYMHSLPATAVLKTNEQGEYSNGKGIGRGQAIANFTVGAHYQLDRQKARPVTLQYNINNGYKCRSLNHMCLCFRTIACK